MFKFLKDKLKKAVSIFSKKVEEEAEVKEEVREVPKEEIEAPKEEKISEVGKKPEEPVVVKEEEAKTEELIVEKEAEEEKFETEVEKKQASQGLAVPEDQSLLKPEEEILPEFKEAEIEEGEEPKEPQKEKTKEDIESQLKELKDDIEKEFKEIKPEPEPKKDENQEKLSFFQKIFGKKEKHEEEPVEVKEEKIKKKEAKEETEHKIIPEVKKEKQASLIAETKKEKEKDKAVKEEIEEEPEKRRGLFGRIKETLTTVKLSDEKFEKLFWELEVVLMENNVAVEVIDKIKADLKEELTTGKVSRKGIEGLIEDSLRESVESLFIDKHFNLVDEARKKKDKPYIISFIGVNGSGKTTTMAKVASLLLKNKLSVVFAASDTFRAAAIQQLQEHADKLGVKMIKHDYESDPAAVAFDAVQHAKAKGIDVVLIDTAGRLHVNDNLMNELKKLIRVNQPDLKIFVGESITGNDCIEQAQLFNEAVGIDAIILSKADVDEKGGAAVSVGYVTKKPIIYLGTGQKYEDLTEFKPEIVIKNIGL